MVTVDFIIDLRQWTSVEPWPTPISWIPEHQGKLWWGSIGMVLIQTRWINHTGSQVPWCKTLKDYAIW
jgi:hypothetical protein